MRTASNPLLSLLLMAVLLFAGCSAPRELANGTRIDSAAAATFLALPSLNRDAECLSGNERMTATMNGESATAKGKVRIKRGEGV